MRNHDSQKRHGVSNGPRLRGLPVLALASLCLMSCAVVTTTESDETESPARVAEQTAAAEQEAERSDEPAEEPAEAATGQVVARDEDPDEMLEAEDEPAEPEAASTDAPATPPGNPCDVRAATDEAWLDHFRREVFETVCESASWFDDFFGSRRFDEEARRTHGRGGLRLIWDEDDGVEIDGTLKVQVDFPNLDHEVNAFLGRDEEDVFLTGTEDSLDLLPTFFERESEQEWLLGLGYRPVGNERSALDFDVGIEAETPVDPFVRGRYRYYWLIGDENLLRFRQSVYWTNQRGVGTGTRVDFERPVGEKSLVRWAGSVVFDDEALGADWNTGVTLFHSVTRDQAIAWFIGVDGETGHDVPIQDYGTSVTWRQRMLREWFFGEIITGVTWPRDNLAEQRELAWHLGVGFEISFSGEDLGLGGASPDDETPPEE